MKSPTVNQHAAFSDCGKFRAENQDAYAVCQEIGLFLVADGVGGEGNGTVAARIVAERLPSTLETAYVERVGLSPSDLKPIIAAAIKDLHQQVRSVQSQGKTQATLVLAVIKERAGIIAHLGDSRGYLFRDSRLTRLTKDHSLAQLLVDTGEMEATELAESPFCSQLTRCIGIDGDPAPDFREFEWRPYDVLLLCSDGLTSMLSDDEIHRVLSQDGEVASMSRELVSRANDAGGFDNITVVIVRNLRCETVI